MPKTHPLAEVFGFPIENTSQKAQRYRRLKLCPYNNKVPSCTKDKAQAPLGVCSVFENEALAITCPIRFREEWHVAEDAASFFFPEGTKWTSLTEIRLNDRNGKSAGNIDLVLVSYDNNDKIIDFGALEIQAVYISGNVRRPFEHYMDDYANITDFDWTQEVNYPRPDYLSSSRKRLLPQLIYKGGILNNWRKKTAVALHEGFYDTLPQLPAVPMNEADIAWLIYSLDFDSANSIYKLKKKRVVFTRFTDALARVSNPEPGEICDFIEILQTKLDQKLDELTPPDAPTLQDIVNPNGG
ncbi:MAG: hypothetical protein KKH41_09305 [Candidatus Thermoplasmatota archaeon]|nr:hypothetical protein [Euryarchaeota archaeon]MBU4031467.1 hypothetical protein [Candidatus Thermoplasmatota archaeon]MBU4070775.1 hypothetical protein [Candidatus Thermoplasmatota archaeon]MBU4144676.1 hypothetical protein [Candidatus Thermoplasmatota archaeon]MBU4592763.1 hypothetical protein [Candidatus Thermoplasmatota archaeon]